MTVVQWLWLVGGGVLGAVCAVAWEHFERGDEDDGQWVCGMVLVCVWFLAPFVAAGLAFCGVVAALSWAVRGAANRIPERPSRDAQARRIAELERELEVTRP